MNRTEAQQQLAAVAQALREGRMLDPRDYPILDVRTHEGLRLWRVKDLRLFQPGWSHEHAVFWLEHEAIKQVPLDDEENTELRERQLGG